MPHLILSRLLLCLCGLSLPFASAQAADFTRTEDVVYGRKFGVALTLDVIQPEKPNGFAIVSIISGGWVSNHDGINPAVAKPFLDRGYTVFAVCHGCQPKFTIPEITQDIHRSIRFIRHNASRWGVNPGQIGITGASAGGHLSLTMGTRGGPGKPDAKDPVDRESSAVQAVACFFPPTDFLNYGTTGEDAVGFGILRDFRGAFGPGAETPESRQRLGREVSPIYFVTEKLPPTLIMHGDADKLVPIQQSESFVKRATELGAKARLVAKPGASHGWGGMGADLVVFADWFDESLRGIKPAGPAVK